LIGHVKQKLEYSRTCQGKSRREVDMLSQDKKLIGNVGQRPALDKTGQEKDQKLRTKTNQNKDQKFSSVTCIILCLYSREYRQKGAFHVVKMKLVVTVKGFYILKSNMVHSLIMSFNDPNMYLSRHVHYHHEI
jgi:hypothetical protein